jgi:hypothetical protein
VTARTSARTLTIDEVMATFTPSRFQLDATTWVIVVVVFLNILAAMVIYFR